MSDFSSAGPQQSNLNQSQAFAAALQRAKQIAAKIQPSQGQQQQQPPQALGGGSNNFKRSHDDSDSGPENKRFTSPGGGSGGGGGGNMTQAIAQAAAVAARLVGTSCEEQLRLPESIQQAFFGRGNNETISQIQSESGTKIQLSDNDQILTLRGTRETVTKGRELIQQMANRNGGGTVEVNLTINMPPPGPTGYPPYQELMIPGTKVGLVIGKGGDTIKQLQEKTGAKMVIIQDGPNQELIKPLRITGDPQKIETAKQMVLDLIAQKEAQAGQNANRQPGGNNNGGGGGFNNYGGGGGESCEVFVPKIAVGVVIGKGGDMIRKIQLECGCRLQFIQGKNDEPGDRRCFIQGTAQQVEDAKNMIEGLIENVMQRNRNSNGANGDNSNYGYGYGVNHAQQPPREEICFMVPTTKCGIVIGRGGETIKLINQQSGAYCEMDRNAVNPANEKLFKCKGTTEQVEAARQMISEKINMELPIVSRKPISANIPNHQNNQQSYNADPAAAYQQQQQQQWGACGQQQAAWDPQQQAAMAQSAAAAGGAAGQADYSAQWIEYYKSMGMTREAEHIEQQMKAKQAAQAGGQMGGMPAQAQQQPQQQQAQSNPAGAGAAAGGGADYSAQWAEYFRSIGKIEEAEDIEKQMKQNQNGQANNAAAAGGPGQPGNAPGAPGAPGGGMPQAQQPGGYPQGMTPSQYAQYSQFYAAAAQAQGGAAPGGYPQGGYGGYGAPGASYPGAPQPPGGMPDAYQQKHNKPDKN